MAYITRYLGVHVYFGGIERSHQPLLLEFRTPPYLVQHCPKCNFRDQCDRHLLTSPATFNLDHGKGSPPPPPARARFLHVVYSQTRWRYWNRWLSPGTKASPSSLVDVFTTGNYTRLVLKNPKTQSARGGAFVYLSVPAALGTDEAHAITVALRGAPPLSLAEKVKAFPEEDVFTVYVKDLGPWTKALRSVADGPAAISSPQSLLVDVDGFYNNVQSFSSMMEGGAKRIIVVAGGSGMTSLMGFIQVRFGGGRWGCTVCIHGH